MAFSSQLPPYITGSLQDNNAPSSSQTGLDSITLGQLRNMVNAQPKPKQSWFDFVYDDEDTVMNEIDEFYSYVEMPQVTENARAWEGSFPSEWTKAPLARRKAHVELLIESLEHRNAEIRFTNARRLFYLLQGTFVETVSPEHQLHWIFENCKVVRSANGVSCIIEAMKIASSKHDLLCSLSDQDAAHFQISAAEKADFLEEVLTEISVYLGMLYHLIEVFKGHDDFADELMSLDPPLPVYLFNVVSGLRDKSAKGYPIKKLLLVLWKTLLACFGGIRDYTRVKKLARELAGLPPATEMTEKIKASPLDIETFRQETTVKYPTFVPPKEPTSASLQTSSSSSASPNVPSQLPQLPPPKSTIRPPTTSKLSQAYQPIPIRPHYHHDDLEPSGLPHHGSQFGQQGAGGYRHMPQPATPAPSPPPPSPKPKKQQFQTDQNRPFLFPFSKGQFGVGRDAHGRLVPFAIDEADWLYNKHMYVSLALWQMWKTREDCITAESGLEHMPGEEDFRSSTFLPNDSEAAEPLPDIALLDTKIEEATEELRKAESNNDRRKAKELKEDLMRLKRVEQIYSAVLPVLPGWVLVLLKLLLATVSAGSSGLQVPQSSTSSVFPPGVSSPPEPPTIAPSFEEIDVTRHREITSKAVSAILLLVLKWFKASHVMKFHHLGQLLLDSNCLLLLLKMFGLQEAHLAVVAKNDSPENNFFKYCHLNLSRNPQHSRPEDNVQRPGRQTVTRRTVLPNGETHEEEIEQVTDFSWRNFFSIINFAKVMQKLSKERSHRIWMLAQYKSSAVLKRVLRVMHPMLQLHILKLIKSQVPYCGRKWRQSNMKVITSIYLNCRPNLRDEWLTGTEGEDVSDAQSQEQALRHLVKFYNSKRYGPAAASQHGSHLHRRSGSISHHLEGLHPGPELSNLIRPIGTPNLEAQSDVFPPVRSQAPDPNIFLPYITEDIAFEEEYEEYMSDLGLSDDYTGTGLSSAMGGSAWHRLPLQTDIADNISDSESIVSIGELGDDARMDFGREDRETVDENLNNWEHMSPKTMAALPKSPAGARRSSSGSGLRPVLPFGLDDGSAIDPEDDDELEVPLGPAPREKDGPFAEGAGVDEVEYAYGV